MDPTRRNIVSISAPGDDLIANRSTLLLDGHHVGHYLAGVCLICESVYDWHTRTICQLGKFLRRARADHNGIDVARKNASRIGNAFSTAELGLFGRKVNDVAAKLAHTDMKADPRTG